MSKAETTRLTILRKAFELIYTRGYQATSIDDIIATTKVTKGAFYYHFTTKDEMGLAIISDLLKPAMTHSFIGGLETSSDPVKSIYGLMKYLLLEDPFMDVQHGCPVGNLTQEMTPWNKAFSKALTDLIHQWDLALRACINRGRKNGTIRKDVKAAQVAYFVMSGYWGIRNFGKLNNSKDCYSVYLKELRRYLEDLR
ncbi:MAG TPA: TetR/AcrR family transcriptional regulator [Bacteroidia bacterium]|nr:TetR/AcrR family transcriptional regulator [Bacteroidia bacterium]